MHAPQLGAYPSDIQLGTLPVDPGIQFEGFGQMVVTEAMGQDEPLRAAKSDELSQHPQPRLIARFHPGIERTVFEELSHAPFLSCQRIG
jgi:hypothetical protein